MQCLRTSYTLSLSLSRSQSHTNKRERVKERPGHIFGYYYFTPISRLCYKIRAQNVFLFFVRIFPLELVLHLMDDSFFSCTCVCLCVLVRSMQVVETFQPLASSSRIFLGGGWVLWVSSVREHVPGGQGYGRLGWHHFFLCYCDWGVWAYGLAR